MAKQSPITLHRDGNVASIVLLQPTLNCSRRAWASRLAWTRSRARRPRSGLAARRATSSPRRRRQQLQEVQRRAAPPIRRLADTGVRGSRSCDPDPGPGTGLCLTAASRSPSLRHDLGDGICPLRPVEAVRRADARGGGTQRMAERAGCARRRFVMSGGSTTPRRSEAWTWSPGSSRTTSCSRGDEVRAQAGRWPTSHGARRRYPGIPRGCVNSRRGERRASRGPVRLEDRRTLASFPPTAGKRHRGG